MIQLTINNGENEISNEAGGCVRGNRGPELADGLNPRELLEAAVALCTSITLESVLKRDNIEYNPDEIKVAVQALKDEGVNNRFTNFHVKLTLPSGLDENYQKKIATIVERGCTISNTLSNGAVVELTLCE